MHLLRGADYPGCRALVLKTFGDTVVVRPLIEVSRKEMKNIA